MTPSLFFDKVSTQASSLRIRIGAMYAPDKISGCPTILSPNKGQGANETGDISGRETPVPIPNTAVKPARANGTNAHLGVGRVGRCRSHPPFDHSHHAVRVFEALSLLLACVALLGESERVCVRGGA